MLFKNKKCDNCQTFYDPTLETCPQCHHRNADLFNQPFPHQVLFLHPFAQIALFLIGFPYFGMLIIQLVVASFLTTFSASTNLDYLNTLLVAIIYLIMLIALLLIPLLTRRKLFFEKFKHINNYGWGLTFLVFIYVSSILVNMIMSLFFETPVDNTNQEAAVKIIENYPLVAVVVLAFIGPICEELTYRVGLYSFLRRFNKIFAIIVSSLVFAFIHFDYTAENIYAELYALPSYLITGIIFALAYEYKGPACSMVAHISYNLLATLLIWLV